MSDKIYLASIKEKVFPDGGTTLIVGLGPKDFEILAQNKNKAGWVNLKITRRKEESQYGQTHSMVIDDWTPDTTQARQGVQEAPQQQSQGMPEEDLPF